MALGSSSQPFVFQAVGPAVCPAAAAGNGQARATSLHGVVDASSCERSTSSPRRSRRSSRVRDRVTSSNTPSSIVKFVSSLRSYAVRGYSQPVSGTAGKERRHGTTSRHTTVAGRSVSTGRSSAGSGAYAVAGNSTPSQELVDSAFPKHGAVNPTTHHTAYRHSSLASARNPSVEGLKHQLQPHHRHQNPFQAQVQSHAHLALHEQQTPRATPQPIWSEHSPLRPQACQQQLLQQQPSVYQQPQHLQQLHQQQQESQHQQQQHQHQHQHRYHPQSQQHHSTHASPHAAARPQPQQLQQPHQMQHPQQQAQRQPQPHSQLQPSSGGGRDGTSDESTTSGVTIGWWTPRPSSTERFHQRCPEGPEVYLMQPRAQLLTVNHAATDGLSAESSSSSAAAAAYWTPRLRSLERAATHQSLSSAISVPVSVAPSPGGGQPRSLAAWASVGGGDGECRSCCATPRSGDPAHSSVICPVVAADRRSDLLARRRAGRYAASRRPQSDPPRSYRAYALREARRRAWADRHIAAVEALQAEILTRACITAWRRLSQDKRYPRPVSSATRERHADQMWQRRACRQVLGDWRSHAVSLVRARLTAERDEASEQLARLRRRGSELHLRVARTIVERSAQVNARVLLSAVFSAWYCAFTSAGPSVVGARVEDFRAEFTLSALQSEQGRSSAAAAAAALAAVAPVPQASAALDTIVRRCTPIQASGGYVAVRPSSQLRALDHLPNPCGDAEGTLRHVTWKARSGEIWKIGDDLLLASFAAWRCDVQRTLRERLMGIYERCMHERQAHLRLQQRCLRQTSQAMVWNRLQCAVYAIVAAWRSLRQGSCQDHALAKKIVAAARTSGMKLLRRAWAAWRERQTRPESSKERLRDMANRQTEALIAMAALVIADSEHALLKETMALWVSTRDAAVCARAGDTITWLSDRCSHDGSACGATGFVPAAAECQRPLLKCPSVQSLALSADTVMPREWSPPALLGSSMTDSDPNGFSLSVSVMGETAKSLSQCWDGSRRYGSPPSREWTVCTTAVSRVSESPSPVADSPSSPLLLVSPDGGDSPTDSLSLSAESFLSGVSPSPIATVDGGRPA